MGRSATINVYATLGFNTNLAITPSNTQPKVGESFNLDAVLTDVVGYGANGCTITFHKRVGITGTWALLGSRVTDTNGACTYPQIETVSAVCQYHAEFAGDAVYNSSISNTTQVIVFIGTSITINIVPTTGKIPLPVTISGILRDQNAAFLAGAPVNIYINGVLDDSTTTNGSGAYSVSHIFTNEGTYQVYAEFPGTTTPPYYLGCEETVTWPYDVGPDYTWLIVAGSVAAVVVGGAYLLTRKRR